MMVNTSERSTIKLPRLPAMIERILSRMSQDVVRHPALAQGMLTGFHGQGARDQIEKTNEIVWQRDNLNRYLQSPAVQELLDGLNERAKEMSGPLGQVAQADVTVEYRLVVGFGLSTILETGFLLHPLYGVPYLPGSSIKGITQSYLLHAWAREARLPRLGFAAYGRWQNDHEGESMPYSAFEALLLANRGDPSTCADDEQRWQANVAKVRTSIQTWADVSRVDVKKRQERLDAFDAWAQNARSGQQADAYRALFGAPNQRGETVFLDSFPMPDDNLKVKIDILTSHYGPYYRQEPVTAGNGAQATAAPGDYYDPVPVPFLVVDRGTRFCVSILAPNAIRATFAITAVQRALNYQGIGAKTGSGYGKLHPVTVDTALSESKQS